MKPVICFYKNDQWLYSEDYQRISTDQNVFQFLRETEFKFSSAMKVIQIDFEKTSATVFILNQYSLKTLNELSSSDPVDLKFKPVISKTDFIQKIHLIKSDIGLGRYYQVNLTSSFKTTTTEDSFILFKKYLNLFKSRYSAFLPLVDSEILCYSPELFLEKKESTLRTEPIKGTLATTVDQMMTSEKETAELSMIVDLLRNDLNAVCQSPVVVTKHREVMDLGYTKHTFSEIQGQTQLKLAEILKSTFPGGSISGCPKIESLLAIEELENQPRGFYTGSLGWWKDSDFILNIAIRSFKKQNNTMTYSAGCGIVYDSNPESEWQEFLNKAGHLKLDLSEVL
jgi:anthranilate/para-aminobenzoate synthase component I